MLSKNILILIIVLFYNGCSIAYTVVIDKTKLFPNKCNQNYDIQVDLEFDQYGKIFKKSKTLVDIHLESDEIEIIYIDGGLGYVDAIFYCHNQNGKLIIYESGKVTKAKGVKGKKLYL